MSKFIASLAAHLGRQAADRERLREQHGRALLRQLADALNRGKRNRASRIMGDMAEFPEIRPQALAILKRWSRQIGREKLAWLPTPSCEVCGRRPWNSNVRCENCTYFWGHLEAWVQELDQLWHKEVYCEIGGEG